MLMCISLVTDHRRCQNLVQTLVSRTGICVVVLGETMFAS